jgi:hypothetical protein
MIFPIFVIVISFLVYLYPNQKIGINTPGNYDYYLVLKPGETFVGDLSNIKNIHCVNYVEVHRKIYNQWEPRLFHRNNSHCNESYNFYTLYIVSDREEYNESDTLDLARKYESLNLTSKARSYYSKSIQNIPQDPRTFYAMYRMAVIDMKEDMFLRAYHYYPHRKEPLYYLARFARTRGNLTECLLYARAGLLVGSPSIYELYVEKAIYLYALKEEFGYCLYHTGRVQEYNLLRGL